MRKLRGWQQVLAQVGLAVAGLFTLLPLLAMLRLAFDGSIKGAPAEFALLPKEFTLTVFQSVWQTPSQTLSFLGLLKNSVLVSGGAAAASIILGTSMAYAFARFRFPGKRVGLFALLAGSLLPPVALMTPLYILLSQLGLRTSLWGLVVVYTAFSMPFCIWNMRAAFQAVPRELEEAAFLDGASPLVAFWRVSLPLALPAIGVAAVVAFLAGYTEFAIGWLFVEDSQNVTLAMAVFGMLGLSGMSWSKLAAISLLMSLPMTGLVLALHRWLFEVSVFKNA